MRSVLRDRDHVVLHRASRSRHPSGPATKGNGAPTVENHQPREIRVHFSSAEPYSFSPMIPPTNASGTSTSWVRGSGGLGMTELFRLIEIQKYSLAIQRLYQFPKEASMWVSVPDGTTEFHLNPSDEFAPGPSVSRGSSPAQKPLMLPVHLACEHLTMHPQGGGNDKRRKLEALLAHLVSIFPASCLRRNPLGQLPLHAAIRNGASVETVTAFLCAAPESLVHVDTSTFPHLTPTQINNQLFESTSPTKGTLSHGAADVTDEAAAAAAQEEQHRLEVVKQMLMRGIDFWEMAKQEATLRIKHRNIPAEDASIGSTSVLATSFNHDDASTLATSWSQPHQLPRQLHHFQYQPRDDPPQVPDGSTNRNVRHPRRNHHSTVSFRKRATAPSSSPSPPSTASRQWGIPEESGRSADEQDDENTVNQLLDRIRALEYDKEQLRTEVEALQSELARQEAVRNELGRHQPPMTQSGTDTSSFDTSIGPCTPPPRRDGAAAKPAAAGEPRPVAVHKLQREKETLERKVDALTKSNHVYQNLLQTFTSLHAGGARTVPPPGEATPMSEGGANDSSIDDGRSRPDGKEADDGFVGPPAPPPPTPSDPRESDPVGPTAPLSSSSSPPGLMEFLDGFEVDSVILRAEQLAGHRLSRELVDAWRTVATSSDSVSELGSSSDGQRDVSPLGEEDDDDLDGDLDDDDNVYDDVTYLFSTSSHTSGTPGPRSVV